MRFNRPRPPRDLPPASPRTHEPIDARLRGHPQSPSYDHRDGTEDLETIRAQHPPKRPLNAPIPTDSPIKVAYLAAATTFPGLVIAARDETHPCMIIARTAQAISVAAPTSQSHAAVLAAVNTTEAQAILAYEDKCDPPIFNDEDGPQILINSIDTPVHQTLAQKPPSNPFISHRVLQSAGLVPADVAMTDRALLEAFVLNMHILRTSR